MAEVRFTHTDREGDALTVFHVEPREANGQSRVVVYIEPAIGGTSATYLDLHAASTLRDYLTAVLDG